MKLNLLIVAAGFGLLTACGAAEEETTSSEETTTDVEVVEEPVEEDPWMECYFKTGGYSIQFPGPFESRIDTTEMFHIHLSAYQTEQRYYKVSAYVPIDPVEIEDDMHFIQGMKESMNLNYEIQEEQETAFGQNYGLLIYSTRDGWSFSRFMTVENDLIYILDIAALGELRPSNLEIEEFYGKFQTFPIDPA